MATPEDTLTHTDAAAVLGLYTPPEAAVALRSNRRTLERWRTTGDGPTFIRIGRRIAYRREDLLSYMEQNRVAHTAQRRG